MREEKVGRKYDEKLDVKDIAKNIRAQLRKEFPKVRVSVRIDRYSGGQSIDVFIIDAGFNPINPAWRPNDYSENPSSRYTPAGSALLDRIQRIVDQYNYDSSDSTIDLYDVNYSTYIKYDMDFERRMMQKLGIKVE
jgi:hypothetical protein